MLYFLSNPNQIIYLFNTFSSLCSMHVRFCCDLICSGCCHAMHVACLHTKQGDSRLGQLAHLSLCESAEVENRALDREVGFRGTSRVFTLYNSGCLI